MTHLTREVLIAVLFVVVFSLSGAACGRDDPGSNGENSQETSEDDPGTDDGGDEDTSGEGGGAGGPGAVVSPLKIPAIEAKGAPIGQVRGSIQADFVEACGGELCVDLVERDANGLTVTDECTFSRTDPDEGIQVKRGSTVTLVVRCEDSGSGSEEEESTTTTEESPDGGS
ncbi:MAG TPA: hypothetical protein VGR26_13085 [Acidimicrobiales bacterium]|nr:hypothetical protein [Acidimicrobiales bacterium]